MYMCDNFSKTRYKADLVFIFLNVMLMLMLSGDKNGIYSY